MLVVACQALVVGRGGAVQLGGLVLVLFGGATEVVGTAGLIFRLKMRF